MNTDTDFDIVIAGGGLSGCLMALALSAQHNVKAGKPLSIAIVEANPKAQHISANQGASFDSRVLALAHGSAAYLAELGAWSHIESNATAINNIHISDRGFYGKARIYRDQHQVDALGYVVEMSSLGQGLLKALASYSNVTWLTGTAITEVNWHPDNVVVKLADVNNTVDGETKTVSTNTVSTNTEISSKLLLGCDGAKSPCRQFANITIHQQPYQQSALIANVQMSKAHQNLAYERFTETGPIAMLPMGNDMCSLVWTLTPEQAQAHLSLGEDDFKSALETAFGYWLGKVIRVSERFVYPLSLVLAETNVYHRMALVGNASHTIHPIAGQGFNLGLRDVSYLANLLLSAHQQGRDIGAFGLLNQYDQQRQQDHQAVIGLTDSLVTLFSNQHAPLVAGRNIALKALNYLTPTKTAFVAKTMGY